MIKYFNNCNSAEELRKEYINLIKKYHPDLTNSKEEFDKHNNICAEINAEYEMLLKTFPNIKKSNHKDTYIDYIINGNEKARNIFNEIYNNFFNVKIDYNYYNSLNGLKWWEEQISIEMENSFNAFWEICISKKIVGEEFVRLFELCDYNVEKMRRTIMFFSTGAISENDIHTNLTSDICIPFFNDIAIENLPDYNSFLLLSKENTKKETLNAWIEFCQKQRDIFNEKFYETTTKRIGPKK